MKSWRGLAMAVLLLAVPVAESAELRATDSYRVITKTVTAAFAAQTAAALWTPPTGQDIVLQGCYASADNAIAFKVQQGSTDVIPLTFITTYGEVTVGLNLSPIWQGTKDQALTYTTQNLASGTLGRFSLTCVGYEENRQ